MKFDTVSEDEDLDDEDLYDNNEDEEEMDEFNEDEMNEDNYRTTFEIEEDPDGDVSELSEFGEE